jgi:predicted nucleic acid-binding protein
VIRAYFDSSAIMKLAKEEAESQALIDYLGDHTLEASTSVLAQVEVPRNLLRCKVDPQGALRGFYLLAIDDDVRQMAVEIGASSVRSLDAIHIATAVSIGDRDLQFITYDDSQADAARAAGLTVVQPGRNG